MDYLDSSIFKCIFLLTIPSTSFVVSASYGGMFIAIVGGSVVGSLLVGLIWVAGVVGLLPITGAKVAVLWIFVCLILWIFLYAGFGHFWGS